MVLEVCSLSYWEISWICCKIRFERCAVTALEAAYSLSAFSTGLAMPNPPKRTGSDKTSLSVSETDLPNRDGMRTSLMHSSRGMNRWLMFGRVLWRKFHLWQMPLVKPDSAAWGSSRAMWAKFFQIRDPFVHLRCNILTFEFIWTNSCTKMSFPLAWYFDTSVSEQTSGLSKQRRIFKNKNAFAGLRIISIFWP